MPGNKWIINQCRSWVISTIFIEWKAINDEKECVRYKGLTRKVLRKWVILLSLKSAKYYPIVKEKK